ncbi:MAG: molybdopterin-dependent oxidoreductase, partial [Desulfobacteraceae bacterium]|nr:molybdopterin-dependent oxidoreductase [Desulfobacteraceae bacterium]
ALTGNLDKLGSDLEPMYPITGANSSKANLSDLMTPEIWKTNVSSARNHFPWFKRVLPADIITAVNTGEPYKISSIYVCGSNPILTFSNSKNTFDALKKVDFLAVSDRFMTPTASLADIILPPATFLEYESIIAPPYFSNAGCQQKAVHVDGALSDFDITTRLANDLGLGHLFYENIHDFFDMILEPADLTFKEFKEIKTLTGERKEDKYLSGGFSTPSGKVELYSKQLLDAGFTPLPDYIEPCKLSSDFPLVLTCRKSGFFRHSDNRQLNSLRSADKEPIVRIHSKTAIRFNIIDGDMITITTANGEISQKVKITDDIRPDVILADFGWWFPEKEITLQNWQQANINMLTSDQGHFSPEIGST